MKVWIIYALLVLIQLLLKPVSLWGQDAVFSQFFASALYLNPSFAGTSQSSSRLNLNYRNHPFPDSEGFATIFVSYDAFIPSLHGGIGFVVTSDNQGGLHAKNHFAGIYSYHLKARENLFINFSTQVGYYRQDIYWHRLKFVNSDQPPPEKTWNHSSNFAAGILVYNNWFFGGIAAHHLTQPRESIFGDERLARKYTAHAGLSLEPTKNRIANTLAFDYFLSPNIIFQQQGEFRRMNLGLYGGIESLMAGAWFRHDLNNANTLVFLVGFQHNNLQVGYSYDHSLSGYSDAFHASHEVSISFEFFTAQQRNRQRIIKCPKF